jgi:hypothetical protein
MDGHVRVCPVCPVSQRWEVSEDGKKPAIVTFAAAPCFRSLMASMNFRIDPKIYQRKASPKSQSVQHPAT